MLIPWIGFMVTVLFALAFAFALSYLLWSDRRKTPEILAVEIGYFSEVFSRNLSVAGAGILAFALFLAIAYIRMG